jgi:VanZ family protein
MASGSEKSRFFWYACVVVYAGFIFLASSIPVPEVVPDIYGFDKFMHFAVYSVFGWLLAMWLRDSHRYFATASSIVLLALGISFSYGAFIELWQHFTPGRNPSIADAAANGAGGLFGASIHGILERKGFI